MSQQEKLLFLSFTLSCFAFALIPIGIAIIYIPLTFVVLSLFYIVRYWSRGLSLFIVGFLLIMLGNLAKSQHFPGGGFCLLIGAVMSMISGIIIVIMAIWAENFSHDCYLIFLGGTLFLIQNIALFIREFTNANWSAFLYVQLVPAFVLTSFFIIGKTRSTKSNINVIPRLFALVTCYNVYLYTRYLF